MTILWLKMRSKVITFRAFLAILTCFCVAVYYGKISKGDEYINTGISGDKTNTGPSYLDQTPIDNIDREHKEIVLDGNTSAKQLHNPDVPQEVHLSLNSRPKW